MYVETRLTNYRNAFQRRTHREMSSLGGRQGGKMDLKAENGVCQRANAAESMPYALNVADSYAVPEYHGQEFTLLPSTRSSEESFVASEIATQINRQSSLRKSLVLGWFHSGCFQEVRWLVSSSAVDLH
jgi:hypothetical protein